MHMASWIKHPELFSNLCVALFESMVGSHWHRHRAHGGLIQNKARALHDSNMRYIFTYLNATKSNNDRHEWSEMNATKKMYDEHSVHQKKTAVWMQNGSHIHRVAARPNVERQIDHCWYISGARMHTVEVAPWTSYQNETNARGSVTKTMQFLADGSNLRFVNLSICKFSSFLFPVSRSPSNTFLSYSHCAYTHTDNSQCIAKRTNWSRRAEQKSALNIAGRAQRWQWGDLCVMCNGKNKQQKLKRTTSENIYQLGIEYWPVRRGSAWW